MNCSLSVKTINDKCPICLKTISIHDKIVLISDELCLSSKKLNIDNLISNMLAYHGECMQASNINYLSAKIRENSKSLRQALRYTGITITEQDSHLFCLEHEKKDIKNIIKLWFTQNNICI